MNSLLSPVASLLPASAQQKADAEHLRQIVAFLASIGLEVQERPLPDATFLPGILIERGQLVMDRSRLLYPGDLLHEAGHIAVTPAAERTAVGGNVAENAPEKDGDELAVLLWTYAACQVMHLPPEVVFHPAGYKGQSEWLITNFDKGTYIGLPLLAWMGLTTADTFPRMSRWLRA